jgi:Carbohydrate family 9 binding domain-like/Secretion system C-terminal sorting domain
MKRNRLNFKSMLATISLGCMSMLAMGQITQLPVIDGDGTDAAWSTAIPIPITTVVTTNELPIYSTADLSGTAYLLWSADSVYVKVSVLDDTLYYNPADVSNKFRYDNIDIFFDLNNQKTPGYVGNTQFYYEHNWWDNLMGARYGANWVTPPFGNWAAIVDTGVGYTIELSFAWSQFGVTPALRKAIGWDCKLSDNDGHGRKQLAFKDKTDGGYANPSLFGTLWLNADGSMTTVNPFAPVIDGKGDDYIWSITDSVNILRKIINLPTPIYNAADLSGSFKVTWTTDSMYVLVHEFDDTLYHDPANSANNYLYDNIDIHFDLKDQKSSSFLDTTQFYYEHNWWDNGMGARFGANWATPPFGKWEAVVDTGVGYTIELSFGWNQFGVHPVVGSYIGFDVKLSDNDGHGRKQLAWSDSTDNNYQNPSLFGTLIAEANDQFLAINDRLLKPAAFTATVTEDTVVTLTWNAVAGAVGYNVYKGTTLIGDSITALTLVNNVPKVAATIKYSIRAIDSRNIVSPASLANAVITITPPNSVQQNEITGLKVYPVPASDFVNVSAASPILSVAVIDISGKLLIEKDNLNVNNYQVDLSGLNSGMYFLKINSGSATVVSKLLKK